VPFNHRATSSGPVRAGEAGTVARRDVSSGEDATHRAQTKTLRDEWIVMQQSHPFQEEMMRKMKGWCGLRTAVIALGLVAGTATGAKAAPILTYSTAVQIDSTGVTGPNVISFLPASSQGFELTGKDNFALGSFQVAPNNTGTTTYSNTPFSVTMIPQSLDSTPISNVSPIKLTGKINGEVSGAYHSTLQATFDPIPQTTLPIGTGTASLNVVDNPVLIVPSSTNGGKTTLEGQLLSTGINEAPVPEPSTIALFLTTLGGLGLRRRVLARRRASA
jgi:hypothetical protein